MEQNNLLNEFTQPAYEFATAGQRLANYLIDLVIFYIIDFIVGMMLGLLKIINSNDGDIDVLAILISFSVFFIYYTLMEGSKGKTVGKMATKTKVLTEDGNPISYKQALLRSLCRIVPFEFLSAFGGSQMWHDKWVNTMVVKDK